jgi:hypothetical protein
VNLVDDVNFVISARREPHVLAKFAYLIDAVVTCAIDLEHIEADPFGYFAARIAYSARVDGWAVDTIYGFGQNSGCRSLSGSTRTDEKVGMSKAPLLNCVFQGPDDVILTQNIVKNPGPVFPGKDLVTHVRNVARV